MRERFVTTDGINAAAQLLAEKILAVKKKPYIRAFGIRGGGVSAAIALAAVNKGFSVVGDINDSDVIISDVIDSGNTYSSCKSKDNFYALFAKHKVFSDIVGKVYEDDWISLAWELPAVVQSDGDVIRRAIQIIGDDPSRSALQDTPHRVLTAWETWFGGYKENPVELAKTFNNQHMNVDEMVIEVDIPFYSHCEHHMAPFFGLASVAYIPDEKIIGLSKMNQIVDAFARRLQVQERMTNQIADILDEILKPKGVGVLLRARHLCVESRGVKHRGCTTTTSALRGAIKNEPDCRAEFIALAKTETRI